MQNACSVLRPVGLGAIHGIPLLMMFYKCDPGPRGSTARGRHTPKDNLKLIEWVE